MSGSWTNQHATVNAMSLYMYNITEKQASWLAFKGQKSTCFAVTFSWARLNE